MELTLFFFVYHECSVIESANVIPNRCCLGSWHLCQCLVSDWSGIQRKNLTYDGQVIWYGPRIRLNIYQEKRRFMNPYCWYGCIDQYFNFTKIPDYFAIFYIKLYLEYTSYIFRIYQVQSFPWSQIRLKYADRSQMGNSASCTVQHRFQLKILIFWISYSFPGNLE